MLKQPPVPACFRDRYVTRSGTRHSMKHFIFFLPALFMLPVLFSCNTNSDQQAKRVEVLADSVVMTSNENSLPDETIAFFNGTDFSRYAKSRSAGIEWDNFTLTRFWTEDSMLTT